MPKFLKRSLILALSALALAAFMLAACSFTQMFEWDISNDGTDWRCLNVRDGAATFVYVDSDAPPRLSSLPARSSYTSCLVAYRMYSVKNGVMVRNLTVPNLLLASRRQRLIVADQAHIACKPKSFAGFFLDVGSSPREIVLRIPLAAVVLLFGLLPTLSFVSWLRLRARRKHENLCLTCGYNLTGNTTGICPECGTPLAPEGVKRE